MIEVLVADDHAFFRAAVVDLLTDADDTAVVAECSNGAEVLPAFRRVRPDVVLLDLAMPGTTGLEAARAVLAADPGARVLMLTGDASAESVREARRLGVAGYLLKDDDPAMLPVHVRTVAEGGSVWSDGVRSLVDVPADHPEP
ncbi:response regulator transcription factor [Geodermatophilus sp. SYSU D01045]